MSSNFLNQLDFSSDFVALNFQDWQMAESKQKKFRMVSRLRRVQKAVLPKAPSPAKRASKKA